MRKIVAPTFASLEYGAEETATCSLEPDDLRRLLGGVARDDR
ncbi:hypothetical protein ABZ912_58070 [Nonomuraea angiospora]